MNSIPADSRAIFTFSKVPLREGGTPPAASNR